MFIGDDLKKRILETIKDVFPLDRLLPLETVYSIFLEEYTKTNDKNLFFRDRKFQRLREGYFALFVAISLNETTSEKHFLLFPSLPDNDMYIAYPKREVLTGYSFDVKEFTNWSKSFMDFIDNKIIPKVDAYNIIIATYRKIDINDINYLTECLNKKNINSKIWVLGALTEENENYDISHVAIVNKNGFIYNKVINLNNWIDKIKPRIVYQDIVRLVPFSIKD